VWRSLLPRRAGQRPEDAGIGRHLARMTQRRSGVEWVTGGRLQGQRRAAHRCSSHQHGAPTGGRLESAGDDEAHGGSGGWRIGAWQRCSEDGHSSERRPEGLHTTAVLAAAAPGVAERWLLPRQCGD
jgi:hypothetical protein